jgi:hypothetical protein
LQDSGRQVDAPTVHVGLLGVEPERAGADDATVDDELHPVDVHRDPFPEAALANGLQDAELGPPKAGLAAIGEADAIGVCPIGRRSDDDSDGAARHREARLADEDLVFRNDPCTGWHDELHAAIVATEDVHVRDLGELLPFDRKSRNTSKILIDLHYSQL